MEEGKDQEVSVALMKYDFVYKTKHIHLSALSQQNVLGSWHDCLQLSATTSKL